jgi:cytochrome P450
VSELPPPPLVDFDHNAPEHAADPIGDFDTLRRTCPVAYSQHHGGFWIATRYDDVARIARDPATFSTRQLDGGLSGLVIPPLPSPVVNAPLEIDPPGFEPYRMLLAPLLSPKAVEAMQPMIDHHTDWFLDQVIERGSMEAITEFAHAVPSTITIDWIGLPAEDWRAFAEPAYHLQHSPPGSAELEHAIAGMQWVMRTVGDALAERRGGPRDDVLSIIANAVIDGEPIEAGVALGTAQLLLAGGVNTTTALTGHALVYLGRHREVHGRLLADDRFLYTATEELLRYATPVLSIARTVALDTELGGQRLRAGDRILFSWAGANRDETVFDCPHEVDLARWPNRHASFGLGPHRCIGSNLARAMFKTMLRRLLIRLPDFRVESAIPAASRAIDNSWTRLDVSFTPGPRVLPDEPLTSRYVHRELP